MPDGVLDAAKPHNRARVSCRPPALVDIDPTADCPPQRHAHDLRMQIPQRRLNRSARMRKRFGAGQHRKSPRRVKRRGKRLAFYIRDQAIHNDTLVLLERFGQVPIGCKRRAFARADAPSMIDNLDDKPLANRKRPLSRDNRVHKRERDAMQQHPLNVDALLIQPRKLLPIRFSNARARKRIERDNAIRLSEARQGRARRSTCRLGDTEETIRIRMVAFDERNGTATPRFVGNADHKRVGCAGSRQQCSAHRLRVDVLAAGHEHVGSSLADEQAPVAQRRSIARGEEPINVRPRSRHANVARTYARPAYGQPTEPVVSLIENARLNACHQLHTAIVRRTIGSGGHTLGRNHARRLGHAEARIHGDALRLRARKRAAIQRRTSQQHASIRRKCFGALGHGVAPFAERQQILKHLVHNRQMRRPRTRSIIEHAIGAEALVQQKRPRLNQAANNHLQPTHMAQRQRGLP